DHDALGPPTYRPGEVKVGGRCGSARQNERTERREVGVEAIDLAFQPRHLRVRYRQARALRPLFGQAEIGLHIEQIILNASQHRVERRITGDMEANQPDNGIDLVKRAIRLHAQIVFLASLVVAERGRAVIAGARVDAVENHHNQRPMAQIASMMMTIATACSNTRRRISFCEVLGEPPRIMLARPSNSTTATAPIAIGTMMVDRNVPISSTLASRLDTGHWRFDVIESG